MLKEFLYDWGGLNESIFLAVNSFFGKNEYDKIMVSADFIGGHHNFGYHMSVLTLLAIISFYRHRRHNLQLKRVTLGWLELFSTLLISLFLSYMVIFEIKNLLELPRPFCSDHLTNIHTIPDVLDVPCNHSFPSGHMAFISVFIASFWPFINKYLKIISIIGVIFIGISRMVAGAHFPADLIWAIIFCLPITIFTRHVVRYILNRYYKFYKEYIPWLKKIES